MYAHGCLKLVFVHQGTFAEDPTLKYFLREVAVDEATLLKKFPSTVPEVYLCKSSF